MSTDSTLIFRCFFNNSTIYYSAKREREKIAIKLQRTSIKELLFKKKNSFYYPTDEWSFVSCENISFAKKKNRKF